MRAGDLVKEGTILARLDDRELKLERLKWIGQEEELSKQFRQAMADRNAAQVQIVSSQLEQARAQVARVEDQLSPHDASPRRSTAWSCPATFPSSWARRSSAARCCSRSRRWTSFRLVAESRRARRGVRQGRTARYAADVRLPERADRIRGREDHPGVHAARGHATSSASRRKLDRTDPRMRPGMEGVGKIEIDERRYIWIWTRSAIDSLRLMLWQWLP